MSRPPSRAAAAGRAKAIWTALAAVILALSFAPIWLVQATTGTRIALVVIHVAVALLPMVQVSNRSSKGGKNSKSSA